MQVNNHMWGNRITIVIFKMSILGLSGVFVEYAGVEAMKNGNTGMRTIFMDIYSQH